MRPTFAKFTVVCGLILAIAPVGAADVSRQQADVFARKLGEIAKPNPPAIRPGMRRTPLTEGELNSWFAFRAQPLLPTGVTAPQVSILGSGKVAGQAVVDLDVVSRRRSSGGMLDPWRLVGGRVPVNVTGTLQTKDGVGRFELESAEISGVPVPKLLLQEMVSYYSRTEKSPQGLQLDAPFTLPANIQQIEVGQGRAVIIQ
jgi:hypothetical protein